MFQEADIALGPFGLTASRASVVKFSNPVIIDYYRILLKRNLPVADPWSFLKPYGPFVWLGIIISFFVVTLVMAYAIVRLRFMEERRMVKIKLERAIDKREFMYLNAEEGTKSLLGKGLKQFSSTFWDLYSLFMQQSKSKHI